MRPLPIPEDDSVPHGIMARVRHVILSGVWLYPDWWRSCANPILERPHIFKLLFRHFLCLFVGSK
uniref:Uncharacterized protein n=1 Tax=Arundo donax TaxID=35708 RepID=A0A0A9E6Y6_ARUDO